LAHAHGKRDHAGPSISTILAQFSTDEVYHNG
jgi:hypothetical protein